jgi:hypothetical protein
MTNTRRAQAMQRMSYWLLRAVPFLAVALVGVRALRVPGVHQAIGIVVFAAICMAVWTLGARVVKAGTEASRMRPVAGGLLLIPFALVSLLWVGLGPPWGATPAENLMRYLVLLVGSVAITGGFVVLKEVLSEAGERLYSALGFGTGILAGAAYMIWLSVQVGGWSARVRMVEMPSPVASLEYASDTLLFVACAVTYLAAAAFAASLGKTCLIGRRVSQVFVVLNLIALVFLVMRGLAFPDPAAITTPWYTQPGFIAGIPAVPWIVPHLMGAALLRRARSEQM